MRLLIAHQVNTWQDVLSIKLVEGVDHGLLQRFSHVRHGNGLGDVSAGCCGIYLAGWRAAAGGALG